MGSSSISPFQTVDERCQSGGLTEEFSVSVGMCSVADDVTKAVVRSWPSLNGRIVH
jgi:hypothetical protein